MRKPEFDSKLIIYRSRRLFLGISALAMTLVFATILFQNEHNGYAWYVLALPFISIGLLFLFVPMTEKWEYKPWQGKPRKIEQQER